LLLTLISARGCLVQTMITLLDNYSQEPPPTLA
jgi:hypothetical protein